MNNNNDFRFSCISVENTLDKLQYNLMSDLLNNNLKISDYSKTILHLDFIYISTSPNFIRRENKLIFRKKN